MNVSLADEYPLRRVTGKSALASAAACVDPGLRRDDVIMVRLACPTASVIPAQAGIHASLIELLGSNDFPTFQR
jgi:hypothetical protein